MAPFHIDNDRLPTLASTNHRPVCRCAYVEVHTPRGTQHDKPLDHVQDHEARGSKLENLPFARNRQRRSCVPGSRTQTPARSPCPLLSAKHASGWTEAAVLSVLECVLLLCASTGEKRSLLRREGRPRVGESVAAPREFEFELEYEWSSGLRSMTASRTGRRRVPAALASCNTVCTCNAPRQPESSSPDSWADTAFLSCPHDSANASLACHWQQ